MKYFDERRAAEKERCKRIVLERMSKEPLSNRPILWTPRELYFACNLTMPRRTDGRPVRFMKPTALHEALDELVEQGHIWHVMAGRHPDGTPKRLYGLQERFDN